jgi:hypothetical protein
MVMVAQEHLDRRGELGELSANPGSVRVNLAHIFQFGDEVAQFLTIELRQFGMR